MYWKARRYPDARRELEECLRLDPKFFEAQLYLAETNLSEEKPDRALPMLQLLAREEPRNGRVQLNLGKALAKLDRAEDALPLKFFLACLLAPAGGCEAGPS